MIYIIIGVGAYLFFVLYDLNSIIMKNSLLNCSFFVGVLLQIIAAAGIILPSFHRIKFASYQAGIFGVPAIFFFCMLIYTLFFALPFGATYLTAGAPAKICRRGVYALCRHPGVLWYTGFYLFLGLALQITLLIISAVIFSIFNLFYVTFQDRWTFMKCFEDYGVYKMETPFLLPNRKSIKRCLQTLKWKEGTVS